MLVVLREVIEEKDGYGFRKLIQYRELALVNGRFVCRVWRSKAENGGGVFTVDAEYNPKPKGKDFWDEIPFTFVGAQNNDETIDDPPLATLAEINLGHYRNSADYEDSVWFCGQVAMHPVSGIQIFSKRGMNTNLCLHHVVILQTECRHIVRDIPHRKSWRWLWSRARQFQPRHFVGMRIVFITLPND